MRLGQTGVSVCGKPSPPTRPSPEPLDHQATPICWPTHSNIPTSTSDDQQTPADFINEGGVELEANKKKRTGKKDINLQNKIKISKIKPNCCPPPLAPPPLEGNCYERRPLAGNGGQTAVPAIPRSRPASYRCDPVRGAKVE